MFKRVCDASERTKDPYVVVWAHLMPLAVALSLLSTNLRDVVKQSGAVLAAFCVGAAAGLRLVY